MTLTAVQRRALLESDADTGQLSAREPTCAALARQGLAVRYGRTGGYYLTQEGRRVRTELARVELPAPESAAAPAIAPGPEPAAAPERGFAADDGHGTGTAAPRRAAEVASAWSGLLEIRRVLQDGDTTRPAPWERERLVHAVALALEAAAGPRPGATPPGGPRPPDTPSRPPPRAGSPRCPGTPPSRTPPPAPPSPSWPGARTSWRRTAGSARSTTTAGGGRSCWSRPAGPEGAGWRQRP